LVKGFFSVVVIVDLVLLIVPTAWLGWRTEVFLAATLAAATALSWCLIRMGGETD
jgi:hypothetical protein